MGRSRLCPSPTPRRRSSRRGSRRPQRPPSPPPATNPGASTMQQGQQLQPPPPAIAALGIPTTGPGVPIHQVQFPPSPSPLPVWLAGSLEPVYTTASVGPHVLPLLTTHPAMQFGGCSGSAEPFASVDGSLFQGGTLMLAYLAPSSSLLRADEVHPPVVHVQTPPRFSKLEFVTYDGTVDPLNWLNQCDQAGDSARLRPTAPGSPRIIFEEPHKRGTTPSNRKRAACHHGSASAICASCFGPPIRRSRLAELGRLSFLTSVQDFADRFQALACHAPGVSARQRAELFVGGLPGHIRVDVEMRGPQDLQTAMYYARAWPSSRRHRPGPLGRHPGRKFPPKVGLPRLPRRPLRVVLQLRRALRTGPCLPTTLLPGGCRLH
ncbi:uncharacterized protein LOC119325663 isoform X2 [Triticum dicoccoides]|uniref:uncharacterized protein LOC119325663 isoform X2 n=1 Tax=Triticum dicoccoides TaxID=85692 RepID=UPI00188E486D|nr:uncharacterized protein LOC119325663 isoform X2 [Triticum dicoccoides]